YVIAAADVDGDGRADLAVGGPAGADAGTPGRITLFRAGPSGLTVAGFVAAAPGLAGVELADVTGDHTLDLVAWDAAPPSAAVRVYRGLTGGNFSQPAETAAAFDLAAAPAGNVPPRFGVADLNGDGAPDLVVPDAGARQFVLAL